MRVIAGGITVMGGRSSKLIDRTEGPARTITWIMCAEEGSDRSGASRPRVPRDAWRHNPMYIGRAGIRRDMIFDGDGSLAFVRAMDMWITPVRPGSS